MPTPRVADERESLAGLLKRLATDGIELVQAELSLARAEAIGISRSFILAGATILTCFIFLIATVMMLAEAAALGLQPYFSSAPLAYLTVALVMLILTILSGWLGVKLITRQYQPVGTIFKWVTGRKLK